MSKDMASGENYRPAFVDPPGKKLAGLDVSQLDLPSPYVSYGLPYYQACTKHIRDTLKASRVYIIASGTLGRQTDRVDKLVNAIKAEAGVEVVGVKTGFRPHTPWSQILEITAECKKTQANCIVTLGAGSNTDGGKLIVLALANNIKEPGQLAMYSAGSKDSPADIHKPIVPLITIPTSLSGGEYFGLAGGTDDETTQKHGFLHSGMGSKLVILDPELCLTTPPYHWLSTGIRSVDHCVEALCCLDSTANSDEKATKGLKLLVPNLLKCKADDAGTDIEARHQCQMGVILAMDNIRAGIDMGGSHAIGHQLGPLGVPHGVTSCVLNPAVMKYNLQHGDSKISQKQEKVKQILWSEPEVAKMFKNVGLEQDKADLGDLMDAVIRALGLPRSLKEVSVDPALIPSLSARALDDFWAPTNPVPLLKADQVRDILEAAA